MNAPIEPATLADEGHPGSAASPERPGAPRPPTVSDRPRPRLRILGIRGLPAQHGGFETFAEHLALYLVERGWEVVVYCQSASVTTTVEDDWRGVRRVLIPAPDGALGSVVFDWRSISHAARSADLCLTLGYNTAVFTWRLRLAGVRNVINMDGIEWARGKWGPVSKAWFYLNDWAGCWLGDGLVADHPEILTHLASRGVRNRVTMIPYGARELRDAEAAPLAEFGLEPGRFLLVIARPEPENSILEIVEAHAASGVDHPLVLLGAYYDNHRYHQKVRAAAGPRTRFLGAIYDARKVAALRVHATAYLHGHRVGGTNPSLVEALGAGSAVIAHDNRFNRWVAGPQALYFDSVSACSDCIRGVVVDAGLRARMRAASRARFAEQFTLERIHAEYESLLAAHALRHSA